MTLNEVHSFPPASSGQTTCPVCGFTVTETSGLPPEACTYDYRITFGFQYPREPHPTWPYAHHDGWVRITAPTEYAARTVAVRRFAQRWSMLYSPEDWTEADAEFFPLGELAHATITRYDPQTLLEDGLPVAEHEWDQTEAEAKLGEVVVEVESDG